MKKFFSDFKKFISRGNVIDMAVGVIIGGAFSKIVNSLVNDVIMPVISKIIGTVNFTELKIVLGSSPKAPVVRIGSFIQNVVNFLIIALVIFILIKEVNKVSSLIIKTEIEKPIKKTCPYCKSQIAIDATRCPNCTSELNN